MHQMRILGGQGLIVHADLLQCRGAGVGEEDVGGGQQLVHGLEALGGLQIQGDALFVGVVNVIGQRTHAGQRHGEPRGVATGRCFHLDALGAPVGQNTARGGRSHIGGQLHDAHALQQIVRIVAHNGDSFS